MGQVTLALAMIAKDEAAHLESCYRSVEHIVDEFVLVDTGSSDGTRELAERLGARTFDFAWNDNFSDARNEALRHVTSDWVLVMDADEAMSREDADRLTRLVSDGEHDAIELVLANYTADSQAIGWVAVDSPTPETRGAPGYIPVPLIRAFRNRMGFRFSGRVHETILDSVLAGDGKILKSDIKIHHYGKLLGEQGGQNKGEKYLALARLKVQDEPRDAKAWYELGAQLNELERFDEAEDAYRHALALSPNDYLASCGLLDLALRRGKWADATATISHMEQCGQLTPQVATNKAFLLIRAGQTKQSQAVLGKVLSADPSRVLARFYLGYVHDQRGEWQAAEREYLKAVEINPAFQAGEKRLRSFRARKEARVLMQRGELLNAAKKAKEALAADPQDDLAYNQLGRALAELGYGEEAEKNILRALKLNPSNRAARENLRQVGRSLAKSGEEIEKIIQNIVKEI